MGAPALDARTLCLFDVDGTLTAPRQVEWTDRTCTVQSHQASRRVTDENIRLHVGNADSMVLTFLKNAMFWRWLLRATAKNSSAIITHNKSIISTDLFYINSPKCNGYAKTLACCHHECVSVCRWWPLAWLSSCSSSGLGSGSEWWEAQTWRKSKSSWEKTVKSFSSLYPSFVDPFGYLSLVSNWVCWQVSSVFWPETGSLAF